MRDKRLEFVIHFCRPHVKPRDLQTVNIPGIARMAALTIVPLLCLLALAIAPSIAGAVSLAIVFPALVEANNKLEAKRGELAKVFEEAGPTMDFTRVKCLGDNLTTVSKCEKVKSLNDELTALGVERDSIAQVVQAEAALKRYQGADQGGITHPEPKQGSGAGDGEQRQVKSIGELFTDSDAYKNRHVPGYKAVIQYELKTLFSSSAGWPIAVMRSDRVVDYAVRLPRMIDVMPNSTKRPAGSIEYLEETTFTNAASNVTEGAVKQEAALALTVRTVPMEVIAVVIPVTKQQLDDRAQIQGYLERRLRSMVNLVLDQQIINGTGVSPELMGILNKPSHLTQAKGSDPVPDAIRKAMTKVRVTGEAEPNAVVMHPNDWQDVRLLRTADGIYIWGPPSEAGPERVWGVPVIQTSGMPENTGVTGDFNTFSELVTNGEIEVEVGFVNDDFTRNRKTIRAEIRAAALWYRPTAFCEITGI